jgi:hypothetical protein
MKIELKEITIRELTDGYKDDGEDGVVGYGGRLDIRPPYQREFIYKDKQRDAVIDTVTNQGKRIKKTGCNSYQQFMMLIVDN